MLNIFKYCAVAVLILISGVSCVFMQTRNTNAERATSKTPPTENSADRNDDNMKDIFKINETVEKSFDATSKITLKLYSFEGEITVRAENTPVVKMRATKMAIDKAASDGVRYNFSQQNDRIELAADYTKPDRKITYGKTYFYSKGAYVNWELVLPAESDLILETGEGKIAVSGINGKIRLTTRDGGITVNDSKGDLTASTHDGKVQISGYQGSADVVNRGDEPTLVEGNFQTLSVETGGGNVFLGLSKASGGTLEADAGDISVKDFVLNRNGQNAAGWQKYSFGSGSSVIKVQSNTGRVSIYPY